MWFFLQDKHNINAVSIKYQVYVYSAQNWKKARRISPLFQILSFIHILYIQFIVKPYTNIIYIPLNIQTCWTLDCHSCMCLHWLSLLFLRHCGWVLLSVFYLETYMVIIRKRIIWTMSVHNNEGYFRNGSCVLNKMHRGRVIVLYATFNNISVISCWSILLVEETGIRGENHRPATSHWQTLSHNVVSSTSRQDRHDITEILLKVALNTITPPSPWTGFELTTLVLIGIACTGSYKSNYHRIMITTAPIRYLRFCFYIKLWREHVIFHELMIRSTLCWTTTLN